MSRLSHGPQRPLPHDTTHATGGTDALTPADIGAAASSHTHAQADVTGLTAALDAKEATANKNAANGYAGLDGTGKLDGTQVPYGAAPGTVCQGDDSRLTDARTPMNGSVTDVSVAADAAIARSKLGTGTAHDVVVNAADGTFSGVAPGASGNVLTSNGTVWTSAAPPETIDPALYTAKGTVLGASAASTPAAATNAFEGAHLTKTDESSSGVKWAKGLGFNARFVTSSAGPFDLTDGDQIAISATDGTTYTLTVNAVDVADIDAVTPAEIVNLVLQDGNQNVSARVRDDGKLEFFLQTDGRYPSSLLSLDSISPSMATAFGLSSGSKAYGSGATAPSLTSGNAEAFTFAGTETLTIMTQDGPLNSDTFQVTDTTAALVVARLQGSPAFSNTGLQFSFSSGYVTITYASGSADARIAISGTANAVLGFSTDTQFGDGGAFDEEALGTGGGGGGGGGFLVLPIGHKHTATQTSFASDVMEELSADFGGVTGELEVSGKIDNGSGSVEIELYDVTNAAQVAVVTISSSSFGRQNAAVTFPAGETHYQLRARVTGTTTSASLGLTNLELNF